jgi:predicted Rossmann fold flavoprotein
MLLPMTAPLDVLTENPTAATDLAIVGGGAAGLACAIFAAAPAPAPGSGPDQRPPRITILDAASRLGAKILVSGGGRCNVTHHRATPDDFVAPRSVVRHLLKAFSTQDAIAWFAAMGVTLKHEPTGKLFPTTDSARTILDALLQRCADLNIHILTNARVSAVTLTPDPAPSLDPRLRVSNSPSPPFRLTHARGTLTARALVLATGGRSLPRTGSDGSGYALAQALGHTVTPTHPALVPLVLADDFFHAALAGVSLDVTLATFAGNPPKRIDQRTGALLFTHFGISGPVVMDASRHWTTAQARAERPSLRCNFLTSAVDFAAAERWLIDAATATPRRPIASVLRDRLPARLVEVVCGALTPPVIPSTYMGRLQRDDRRRLVHALTDAELPVVKDRGWNHAEVTAGGVPLEEINPKTMQSRKCAAAPLFLIGELLDCDARIGGFNFQWAWSTAHAAGCTVARVLVDR